jgi:hypothetical protein
MKNPCFETQDKTAMIEGSILRIRGSAAILDSDLALIYGVATKVLNQAVKRNLDRFPPDFMFRLTTQEKIEVVTICDHLARIKFSPVLPYAFTEHGAIMAASVLNSPRAIHMSVFIVRAFVRMREQLLGRSELERRHVVLIRGRVISVRQGRTQGPHPTPTRTNRVPSS